MASNLLHQIEERTIGATTDKFQHTGGCTSVRKFLAAYVGGWSELWLINSWTLAVPVPSTSPVTMFRTETLWAFGLQRGNAASWNTTGTNLHSFGMKAQPRASTENTLLATGSGVDYMNGRLTKFKNIAGVTTEGSISALSWRLTATPLIRSAVALRFVRGTPWTISFLGPATDAATERDITSNDIVDFFNAPDWATAMGYWTALGYSETSYTETIDVGADGEFDAVFMSWHNRSYPLSWAGVFGRVIP